MESKKYSLNKQDLISILWTLSIVMASALIPALISIIGDFDFGESTPIISLVLIALLKAIQKYLAGAKYA